MPSAYSPVIIEHFRRPRNSGAMTAPDASREEVNTLCGDRVRIELRLAGDTVEGARFTGDACAVTVAAASLLTERVSGATVAAAEAITRDEVLAMLEADLPAARVRCALLPLDALRGALRSWRERTPVAAIVLAAGAARRFGAQKMLAPFRGRPLVRWAVEHALASSAAEVVVVLGREAAAVRAALADLPVSFAENPAFAAGMSTSLRAGLAALDPGAPAAVVMLGDQPAVTAEVVDRVIARWRETGAAIVTPVYAGERGHPVLFDRRVFGELALVAGDEGGRAVLARDPGRVERLELPFAAPGDVDTPADLERPV